MTWLATAACCFAPCCCCTNVKNRSGESNEPVSRQILFRTLVISLTTHVCTRCERASVQRANLTIGSPPLKFFHANRKNCGTEQKHASIQLCQRCSCFFPFFFSFFLSSKAIFSVRRTRSGISTCFF